MGAVIFPLNDIVIPQAGADVGTARDLTLDAAQAARSSRTTPKSLSTAQIRKLLDSRNDREVLDGLRKVISVYLPYNYGCILGATLASPLYSHLERICRLELTLFS